MKKILAIMLGAVVATVGLALPAHAGDFVFEGGWGTVPAPTKKAKGIIYGPYAVCDVNKWDEPDTYEIVFRQDDEIVAENDEGYAELKVGTYRATVTATCDGETKATSKTVTLKYLKDSQSVSRSEYKKIKKGQTTKKVRKIIGGKLDYAFKDGGKKYYSKPNTVLGGHAWFVFRKGKLIKKEWMDGIGPHGSFAPR